MGNDCVIAGCDGVGTGEGGVTQTAVDGKVVPFCAQLSAHKSSASVILVVSFCRSAALQQSISIIPPMLHSFSPKCSGTPANALPASTSKRNKDANRFISIGTLVKSANQSQPFQFCAPVEGPRHRHSEIGRQWSCRSFGCAFLRSERAEGAQFHASIEQNPQVRRAKETIAASGRCKRWMHGFDFLE